MRGGHRPDQTDRTDWTDRSDPFESRRVNFHIIYTYGKS